MFAVERPLPPLRASDISAGNDEDDDGEKNRGARESDTHSGACRRLQNAKQRVRVFIDSAGDARWRSIVDQPMPAWTSELRRPVSRAYYKLWEIVKTCALPPASTCVMLCEAPGGFVQACDDLMHPRDWMACSLPNAIRFHASLQRRDHTVYVNVLDPAQRSAFVKDVRARFPNGVGFVTGDGAAEMDHANLEAESLPLLRAQVNVAMDVLAPDGTLVVKAFELCTHESRQLLAHIASSFDAVSLIKPTLSRPTNSEVYVVCRGFVSRRNGSADTKWHAAVESVTDALCVAQERALSNSLRTLEVRKRAR